MAASKKTIKEAMKIILGHLSIDEALCLIEDLLDVKGNKSFTDTISMMYEEVSEAKYEDLNK